MNNKQVEIVFKDDSSLKEKYEVADACRIGIRTRDESMGSVLTFKDDAFYIKLLLRAKYKYSNRSENNKRRGYKVLTDFLKDASKNLYVIKYDFSVSEHTSLISRCINTYPEFAVAISVLVNANVRNESINGKPGLQSEIIQLARYDRSQKFTHKNKCLDNGIKKLYFKTSVDANMPHFHFCSKTQSEYYKNTTGADAISLVDLINYLNDLSYDDNKSILLTDDLDMPYLGIKKKPELYATSKSILKFANDSPNVILRKLFKYNVNDPRNTIYGIEAVIADLMCLLRLRECGYPEELEAIAALKTMGSRIGCIFNNENILIDDYRK